MSDEKEEITVQQAGRRGGTTTMARYGSEFFAAIGRKGGAATRERHGPDFYTEIGRKGGSRTRDLCKAGRAAESS